jgi:putative transposase
MTTPARARYAGYRFPPKSSATVWLYFRFPVGLRMVELLAAPRHHRQP